MSLAKRNINANFVVKRFAKKQEMLRFLRQLGFALGHKRPQYDIWITRKKPYLRTISHPFKDGGYIAKQIGLPLTRQPWQDDGIIRAARCRSQVRGVGSGDGGNKKQASYIFH